MDSRLFATSQHILRDIVLLVALMLLIPAISHLVADVIMPSPRFEDFPCQYKNMHCSKVDGLIGDLIKQKQSMLKSVHSGELSADQRTGVKAKISALEQEISTTKSELAAVRATRDKALRDAREKMQFPHFLIKGGLGLLALLAGYFIGAAPLQAGFVAGGVIALIGVSFEYWGALSSLAKLLLLLTALGLVIAISVGAHKRTTQQRSSF